MKSVWLLLFLLGSGRAQAGEGVASIGVFADPAGTQACLEVKQGSMDTLYVLATIEGARSSLISGAEFRIEVSHPEGWFFNFVSAEGAVRIGNPMHLRTAGPGETTTSGLNVAFPTCVKASPDRPALIGRLLALNLEGGPTRLLIRHHQRPTNREMPCALVTRCNKPFFSALCVEPLEAPDCDLEAPELEAGSGDDPVLAIAVLRPLP